MMRPSRRGARRFTSGFWPAAIGLGAAVALGSWSGCTVTRQNYGALSFFFDGVPNPSNQPGAVAGRGGQGGKPAFVVVHRPFSDDRCDACHKTRYRPSRNDSSICLQCHAGVQTEYPNMHGPVIATACLWCHSPHESSHPHLLRDADRKLCMQCHTAANLDASRVPAHADEARACLECHSGHGSRARYMLKPAETASGAPPERH